MPEPPPTAPDTLPLPPQLDAGCTPWFCRPLLVGLSGGRDSVALLHLLAEQGCELYACHVHHGIRASEADADAAFCRRLCDALGVPLQVVHVDVPALAAASGESMELAARRARLAALAEECHRVGAAAVALAHHADDQAETALFRLARGAAGPRAMRAVSGNAGGVPGVWLRPLLSCRRAELTAWLLARGCSWCEDATNDDPACCTRNALRHEVIPALCQAMGRDVVPILARSARVQADAHDALQEALALLPLTDPQGRLFLPALEGRSPAFVRAALFRYLSLAGVPGVDEALLHRLATILPPTAPCSRLSLPRGWQARRHHRRLELWREGERVEATMGDSSSQPRAMRG